MVFGVVGGQFMPLLIINFACYLSTTCIAAWALNLNINLQLHNGENYVGDYSTTWFLPIALVASMVGMASVVASIRHVCVRRSESFGVAIALSLIAWVFDFVSMGFAVKEVEVSGGYRPRKLIVLEALVIIMAIFELLHFCLLHENSFGFGMVNCPNTYRQPNLTPHVHHHHHGAMPGLGHDHQLSPPSC